MDRGIVMMKGDAGLWTSGTYSLQHLGNALMQYQSVVTVSLSSSGMVVMCLFLQCTRQTKCLLVLLDRLNFRGGVSPGKSQTNDWAFVSGSN